MVDGGPPRGRPRRIPWLGLVGRIVVLGVAALAAAWLLFGPQLTGIVGSFRSVAIGVHNGTDAALLVSAVAPGRDRVFYSIGPTETRFIPGGADDLITILDADCRVLDSRARGHQPPAFLLAEVSDAGVRWVERPLPVAIQPAGSGEPCAVE